MKFVELLFGSGHAKSSRRASKADRRVPLQVESLEVRDLMSGLTWDGNGGDGRNVVWSAWNNWNPGVTPQNGDSLTFAGRFKLRNINDLNLSLQSVTIRADGFVIDGNAITLGSGGIHFVSGNSATWSIPLSIAHGETPIEVYGTRTLQVNDAISGAGGVAKFGVGVAVLNAATTFTGTARSYSGTLRLNDSAALQGSTLDYNNYGGEVSFGSLVAATLGGLAGSQNLALINSSSAAVALTVGANNVDSTYDGVLSGSGRLVKVGSGTLTLSGVHTYSGTTTIADGAMTLNGSLLASDVIVSAGELSGSGSVKSVHLDGGVLSPGNRSGAFTIISGASLQNGIVAMNLNDGVAVDQVTVTGGAVSLGAKLELSAAPAFTSTIGQVFALINNTGAGPLTGTFDDMPDGQLVRLNGKAFLLRYNYDFGADGNANDVVLIRAYQHPTAVDDHFTVDEDQVLTVAGPGVLANDLNPEQESLALAIAQPPAHGTATLGSDGSVTYTPNASFHGLDSLIYQIIDSQGDFHRATVRIDVSSVNDAPVVATNTFKTVTGVVLHGTLRASDVDGPALQYSLVSPPASGQVSLAEDGSFTYTPGSASAVSFRFAVADGTTTVEGSASIAVQYWNGKGIRPDVLAWIYANNPGLKSNFLETEPPDTWVKLPDGQSLQIYRFEQFLNRNFDLDFKSRQADKVDFVQQQEWKLRRLMALPEFYHWILDHAKTYRIAGRGTVSAQQAYDYFRNVSKTVWVTANPKIKAPVGGGNGISAPSWAVWKQMNLFFHEACHVINIGHNSGGLSGPLAGKLRDWDNQKRWNYSTVDLNQVTIQQ